MLDESIETSAPEPVSVLESPQTTTPEVMAGQANISEPVDSTPLAPESPTEAESAIPVNVDNEQLSLQKLLFLANSSTH